MTGQTPTMSEGALRLLYLVGGGIAVGLLLGKLVVWLERRVDDAPIEIILSIVTPYAAYLAAEHIHASGVLSTVACGLFVGRRSVTFFSSNVRIEAFAFWNTLIFALNGIVFILIGFQLPQIQADIVGFSLWELMIQGALFSAVVIVLRLLWMFPGAWFAYLIRRNVLGQRERMPPKRWIFVTGWTGMRGVVALAAALSLPAMLPQRNMILFLTFCVIFVTLVLQGLTLPVLIRKLKLSRPANAEREEEIKARRWMIQSALRELEASEDRRHPDAIAIYDDLAKHYILRLAALERFGGGRLFSKQHDLHEDLSRKFRAIERDAAVALRDGDEISDETLRELLRELDLQDARSRFDYPEEDD
jgi:CPA1 family monovalent cation:H+ antiporter